VGLRHSLHQAASEVASLAGSGGLAGSAGQGGRVATSQRADFAAPAAASATQQQAGASTGSNAVTVPWLQRKSEICRRLRELAERWADAPGCSASCLGRLAWLRLHCSWRSLLKSGGVHLAHQLTGLRARASTSRRWERPRRTWRLLRAWECRLGLQRSCGRRARCTASACRSTATRGLA
jgi:hypothetical protein